MKINELRDACHSAAYEAGWWYHAASGYDQRYVIRHPINDFQKMVAGALVSQKLTLIHSEVSEAMEGFRKGLQDDKLPHRPMIEVELADAVIRIMDLAGAMNLDIGGAIVEKMAYNASREDHKPEARAAAGGKTF